MGEAMKEANTAHRGGDFSPNKIEIWSKIRITNFKAGGMRGGI